MSTAFLFVLPMMVIYQIAIVQADYPVRNAAEFLLSRIPALLGMPLQLINFALILLFVLAMCRPGDHSTFHMKVLPGMAGESAGYAVVLHQVTGVLTVLILGRLGLRLSVFGAFSSVTLALGAGVYEELVFRLLLLGGAAFVLEKVFRLKRPAAVIAAVCISSVLFSLAHHIGPMGDPWSIYTFLFRALAGAALGAIFALRGFGVAAGTHALYNILVLFAQ